MNSTHSSWKRINPGSLLLAAVLGLFAAAVPSAHGQTETILHSFSGGLSDGMNPYLVTPVFDSNGNLYGTTQYGGAYCGGFCGTVFKLTPSGDTWSPTILWSFGNGTDGSTPLAGVVLDGQGNLYSSTFFGGDDDYGTVFELSPSGAETVLHSFVRNGTDGNYPQGSLVLDAEGNLYGTTTYGGDLACGEGCGIVFELSPSGTETILHSFTPNGTDGYHPVGNLLFDNGKLYGTTGQGGVYNGGTVFELVPSKNGWTENILWNFGNGADGLEPFAGLIQDKKGNFYGTTNGGGAYGYGTVFELTRSGTEKVLHSFNFNWTDGMFPAASLVLDDKGNLYGTTSYGGALNYYGGTVFKLTPSGRETILHSFDLFTTDGAQPNSSLAMDTEGNLYGMTLYGGTYENGCTEGCGTVFKITK